MRMDLNDKLNIRIRDLNVSLRCWNTLHRYENIHSVGDLLKWSEEELLLITNFGLGSLKEIKDELAALGLGLNKVNPEKHLKRQSDIKRRINRSISNQLDRLLETKMRYYRNVSEATGCSEDDPFIKAIHEERQRIESDK